MTVFKRTLRGKKSHRYYFEYTDEDGRRRLKCSGTSDKRMATRIRDQHVDRVRAIREGLLDPSAERFRSEAEKPLRGHAQDYLGSCRSRGDAPRTLEEKSRALDWVCDVMGSIRLDQVHPDEFDVRLGVLTTEGLSARTVNLRLEAANALLNWCVRNGRLRANPLRVIEKRNQVLDRRRERRILTLEEQASLISVARRQAEEIPGAETRPLWYLFPLLAGLRRGDMMRMTWGDLELKTRPATLTIRGGKARRRVDVLPLHADLVKELERIRPRTVMPSAEVFPTTVGHNTRRKDFLRAGIALKTDMGVADLHSLRHTFGTRLAALGAAPAKLQKLMRHATIELTMRYYVHLDVMALDDGLSLLGGVEPASKNTAAS